MTGDYQKIVAVVDTCQDIKLNQENDEKSTFVATTAINTTTVDSVNAQNMTGNSGYVSNAGMQKTKSETMLEVGC